MGYEKVKAWREAQPNIRAIRAAEAKRWRAAHPEVAKEIKKRYREKNRDRILPIEAHQAALRRKNDPVGQKRRNESYRLRQIRRQVEVAGRPKPNKCEICSDNEFRIVWDHCHERGHFRGWICDRCNRVLGIVKDNANILKALAHYLE